MNGAKRFARSILPVSVLRILRKAVDFNEFIKFIVEPHRSTTLRERFNLIKRIHEISSKIECPHNNVEMLAVIWKILDSPADRSAVIVEAGSFKGGSAAKFSIAAKMSGRKLVVFDSFEGIPDNNEQHGKNIFGQYTDFRQGSYRGSWEEVK